MTVKRSLFPVLSMLFLTGCAAGAVSSAAVPSTAAPLPGTAETAGTAEAAATPAPTADAVQPPQGLVETGAAVRQFVCLQDDKTYLYSGSMGPGEFITLTDDILRLFSGSTNGLVPAQSGTSTHESDEWYNFVGNGLYVYRCRNSGAANNFVYTAADCFFDAPLAAAQREGKWVYLDTAGHEVTAPCYDGIYQPNHYTDEPLVFARAAPLLSGYAVVSRDGKFGLLDSTGAELVPCAYDGLAWDGGTAWVKLADGWHEYTIPGVTKPDPLADLPDSVTAPDTYPARTDAVFFMADADSTNRLNLRAGPGLEYDILGKISSSTLRVYGYSSAVPGWALVRYDPLYDVPQFGWVSTAYLISAPAQTRLLPPTPARTDAVTTAPTA